MSERELSIGFEAGLPVAFPVHAKLTVAYSKRWTRHGADVVQAIADGVGGVDVLEARAAASEEIDTLLARAAVAGANSALQQKRRLLAKVVTQAVLDDAQIDEAVLIVDALARIDTVHVRALEAIHRAELQAKKSGEMGPVGREPRSPSLLQSAK